jgi:hypothetical protein
MSTYSINTGTKTESVGYPLVTYADVDFILDKLIDNETKLINPWDIRDTILSLYGSNAFKVTPATPSNIEYIGVDNVDPDNKDVKKTILFGKRAYSGTYSYTNSHDILSTFSFSSTDIDVYFYNTKKDNISHNITKVRILAGTALSLHSQSPYIKTQLLSSTTSVSFDFINTSPLGNIDISSISGTVSVNDVVFPSVDVSSASASSGQTLFWQDGQMVWGDITYGNINYIGMTGTDLEIFGSPVNINGYPVEFTDSRAMPLKFNDFLPGTNFSNEAMVEVVKKLIYVYLKPLCSISILSPYSLGVAEVGTSPVPQIQYTITKRTLPTFPTTLTGMIPSVYPAITTNVQSIQTGVSTGVLITPITTAITPYTITVTDGSQSSTASISMQGVYPYFYGFSSLSSMTTIGLASLTKLIEGKSTKSIPVSGSGNFYFIYDYNYGTLSNIYDWLGNTSSGSFSRTDLVFSSPTGLWAAKRFYVYKWSSVSQIGPPSYNFQFKY